MPNVMVSITPKQQRALRQRIRRAGVGSVTEEILKAIDQYLFGPKHGSPAVIAPLDEMTSQDLRAMVRQSTRSSREIDSGLDRREIRITQRSTEGSFRIAPGPLWQHALAVFGTAEKALTWLSRPNRALRGRTPVSLLTSRSGAKRVQVVLGRIQHGVYS